MLRYWAKDKFRSWNKRLIALFVMLSMLLPDLTTFAEPNGWTTDTQSPVCGYNQHEHTDACYEEVQIPDDDSGTRAQDKNLFSVHHHTADCYDGNGNLTCGLTEGKLYHKHTDSCRDEEGNIICGLAENELYIEPEIRTERQLTCGLEEHIHGPDCYKEAAENVLTADQSETPNNENEIPGDAVSETDQTNDQDDRAAETTTDPADGQTADETKEESESTDKETAAPLTDGADDTEATTTDEKAITQATDPETTDTGSAVPEAKASEATETEETTPDHSDTEPTATDKTETETTEPDTTEPETTEPKSEENETDPADAENPGPESVTDKTSTDPDPVDTNTEKTEPEEIPVFEIREDILIRYNGNDEVVTIPDGIRKIDKKAFYNNKTIVKAILPDSVEIINSSAFAECPNLEQIILSDNSRLGLIGEAAFKNDKKLDTSFAANVDRIVANAFDGINAEAVPEEEQTSEEETDHEDSEENKDEITAEDTEPAENNETAEGEEKPEDEEASGQDELQDEEETPETEPTVPDEQTAQAALTLSSDKDAPYQVAITFPAEAGIPEGTELVVAEQAEPQMRLLKTTPKKRALLGPAGAKLLAAEDQSPEETYASIPSLTTWSEGDEAPDIILYQKTLDISLVAGGEEIEPDPGTKVTVSVYLPEIEDGQEITVRHLTDQGPELLESTNNTGTITFTTDSFSLFEFTSTARKLGSWTSDLLENNFFGKTNTQETSYSEITVSDVTEGLTVLEAFNVTYSGNLWMTLQRIKDLMLGKLENIVLYSVEDGKLGGIVKENLTLSDVLRFSPSDLSSFALVRDSGLRRKMADLGNVILNGMMPKDATVSVSDVRKDYADFSEEALTVAAYDISIENNGEEYQPGDSPVTVTIQDEAVLEAIRAGKFLSLWHITDENTREEVKDFTVGENGLSFEATGFSTYVVTETILTETIQASDGNTYEIKVTYDSTAGIPMEGTALLVREITEDEAEYNFYLEESAKEIGTDTNHIGLARPFDIKIVDAEDPTRTYDPTGNVNVSIRLIGAALTDYADIHVIHFTEKEDTEGFATSEMDSTVAEDTVQFTTDSFSVYVVGGEVRVLTFRFFILNEYLEYERLELNADIEDPVYEQIVRSGEWPVAPHNPINPQDPEATFLGWFRGNGTAEITQAQLRLNNGDQCYDFSQPVGALDEDGVINLHAVFTSYRYVIFHDQYDEETETFPVAFTRRIDPGSDNDTYVELDQYKVSYEDPLNINDIEMVFVGWSLTPIRTPNSPNDDNGDPVTKVTTDSHGRLEIDETIHLYPIFEAVKWINYYTGPSGSHATYYTNTPHHNGEGPKSLPGSDVITRDPDSSTKRAYEFDGWYAGASLDDDGEVVIDSAVKIANADGSLIPGATYNAGGIEVIRENSCSVNLTPHIHLSNDVVTLYAAWKPVETAKYYVVIQKLKAEVNATEYEYAERFAFTGNIGDEVDDDTTDGFITKFENSIKKLDTFAGFNTMHPDQQLNSNENNPYLSYQFDHTDYDASAPQTIVADGSTIINVYYKWATLPDMTGKYFDLCFVDSMLNDEGERHAYVERKVEQGNGIRYGDTVSDYKPSDNPVSEISEEGLDFSGWYADEECTQRVAFTVDEHTAHPDWVYYQTMPGANLTLYAGWTRHWFLIKIDPNYGALYKKTINGETVTFEGEGSTWFWKEYGDTFSEYTTVKRDYVESDSGSWYYVKKDRAYYGYPDTWVSGEDQNRQTYYTQTLGEATEMTTFEQNAKVYRYAGWYEVNSDGTEANERYNFESPVDHDITLRLRWIKTGVFYLQYVAGDGTLKHDDENEVLYLELEGNTYSDDADVVVNRIADPPEGYEFVGWRIRQDDSGAIYRPGQTFHLLSKYMATVQGKRTVFLDAVYEKVPTATIVYHFNGGTADSTHVDYGSPVEANSHIHTEFDNIAQTATISRLVNNSEIRLSDGSTWLSRDNIGASFVGWCENPDCVFDVEKSDVYPLLTPGVVYRVGANPGETTENQMVHLYAIWAVDVKYHLYLNDSGGVTSDANFGGDWNEPFRANNIRVYEPYDGTDASPYNTTGLYTQNGVHIGSQISWPIYDPVYTGAESKTFLYWARYNAYHELVRYDFSQPVEEALDLYAIWSSAYKENVRLVDTSAKTVVDKTENWTPVINNEHGVIELSSSYKTPEDIIRDSDFTVPSNYVFAFATVSKNSLEMMQYLQENPVQQIYYKAQDGKVHLIYSDGSDVALDDDEIINFVFYDASKLPIRYIAVGGDGKLTRLSPSNDAPAYTSDLGFDSSHDPVVYNVTQNVTSPMTWITGYSDWSYAIGGPTAEFVDGNTNADYLVLKTDSSDTDNDDDRPNLSIRKTWRGLQYSIDNGIPVNWIDIGYDLELCVAYYTATPTFVTVDMDAIGFEGDKYREYEFDYWVEKISLTDGSVLERTFTTIPATEDTGNHNPFLYHGTTGPVLIKDGSTFTAFLLTDPDATEPYTYRVTFAQRLEPGFTGQAPASIPNDLSNINSLQGWDSSVHDFSRTFAYTAYDAAHASRFGDTGESPNYGGTYYGHFSNTRESVQVDLYVAKVNVNNGILYNHPEWRADNAMPPASNPYTVTISKDGSVDISSDIRSNVVVQADQKYAYAGIIYGSDAHAPEYHLQNGADNDHDIITVESGVPQNCIRLAMEPREPGGRIYAVYLKDAEGNRYELSEMSEEIAAGNSITSYKVYYLYYPMLTIHYVMESSDGILSVITGSTDNGSTEASDTITYDYHTLTLNDMTVTQTQFVELPIEGMTISQEVGLDNDQHKIFNIPPQLDNGTHRLDLVYYKIGASPQADPTTIHPNTSTQYFEGNAANGYTDSEKKIYESGISEKLTLYTEIIDNKLAWKFSDEPGWTTISQWPVVYAIYRERGYNLTIKKIVAEDTGYNEPFTVTITSSAINRDHYPVDGTGLSTIDAEIENGVGKITLPVNDGDIVTIHGLAPGDYTIAETKNENFILTAEVKPTQDENASPINLPVSDNSIVYLSESHPDAANNPYNHTIEADTTLTLTNTPQYICRLKSNKVKYFTLTQAIQDIAAFDADLTETIEMLVPEYLLPASDAPEIPAHLNITLTTAQPDSRDQYNLITDSTPAVLKRKANLTQPMINNLGQLTLNNITFEGNASDENNQPRDSYPSALINNEGTLTIASGATLQNAIHTDNGGKGGAVYSYKGDVKMTGGQIVNCQAIQGGAIFSETDTITISGGTLKDNKATEGGAIYYAGKEGTVTIKGGSIGEDGHPNTASNGGAIYMASGTVNITGGAIQYNRATSDDPISGDPYMDGGCGAAIYALNAYVNISGNTTSISHNSADVNGGAVHMQTLTLKVKGGAISENTAADGGAIWAGTGALELSGGTITGNSATGTIATDPNDPNATLTSGGQGGAIYTVSSEFKMTGGTVSNNSAYQDGGAVYAGSAPVTISNTASNITGNAAANGNGGGIYAGSGTVTISNAKMHGNQATAGYGGALYVGTGSATLTGVQFGESGDNKANQAINGAAVFIESSMATFENISVQYNKATEGGAVGVGSAEVRLNFKNNVVIANNSMTVSSVNENNEPITTNVNSNVYLDFDTDAILNFQSVGNSANIGIYVAENLVTVDGKVTTVLTQRGVPSTRFGVYVNVASGNLTKIHNDRSENLIVKQDTTNKKLYWARNFKIKVYYVDSFAGGLPFGGPDYTNSFATSGSNFVRAAEGTPPSYQNAASEVAEDIRLQGNVSPNGDHDDTAVFGNAFVQADAVANMHYLDYLTNINWNTSTNLWEFTKHDGSNVLGGSTLNDQKTLIFIYTEPYFLSIENNAKDNSGNDLTLEISALTVTVNGMQQSVINNYGYLFAKNDSIQDQLFPVTTSDLVLKSGESIRILLPGGKNMGYSLTGQYYIYDPQNPCSNVPATGTISYIQREITDSTPIMIKDDGSVGAANVTVTGTTPNDSGRIHELIFGGDRGICRLVVGSQIADAVSTEYVSDHAGEGETAGKWEYTFKSPKQANAFILAHHTYFTKGTTVSATIEMLADYMIPANEQVSLSTGGGLKREITFQTAVDGYFRYASDITTADGTGKYENGEYPRATVSRGAGNNTSFIVAPDGTLTDGEYADTLTLKNLIFDGKNFGGDNISGGIVKTKAWNVVIDHVDFYNSRAKFGGGIYIESVDKSSTDKTPYGSLNVRNSQFINCQSTYSEDKYGGGGIWTSMKDVTITDCEFTSCEAVKQGGGLFHYLGGNYSSTTEVSNCSFKGCSSQAAGSMESGAKNVTISDCVFRNSTATQRNGGAVNIWAIDQKEPTADCYVTLENCTFENCYALNGTGDDGNGGAMRSTATHNTIRNCTFTNALGNDGGAINIFNKNAQDTTISGCTFNSCSARNRGGAIFCRSKKLTVDQYNYIDSNENSKTADTGIRNCTATNEGGGIYHENSFTGSDLTIEHTAIDTCSSDKKGGGGLYTTALAVSLTDSTVQNCFTVTKAQNGGGAYLANSTSTTLSGTTIQNCTATGMGGGVFHNANGTFTVENVSAISGNIAQGMGDDSLHNTGGGIYTKAMEFTLKNSSVTENQAYGNGGGICQNYDNASDGKMIIDGVTITGNIAGHEVDSGDDIGKGGGVFTLTNLYLKGITTITDNRLRTGAGTEENAAGVYLQDGVSVYLGATGENKSQHVFNITGNMTVEGKPSNLRLPDTTSGEIVNDMKVTVYCGIDGTIRVVNAKKKLTQFGLGGTEQQPFPNPPGFTDEYKVFWSEDDALYGIVDRQDEAGVEIIWGGEPICKITDGNGRLLYIYIDENNYRPAVFDRLDALTSDHTTDLTTTSAFSTLRRIGTITDTENPTHDGHLYLYNAKEKTFEKYDRSVYQVKMLIENYDAEYYMDVSSDTESDRTVTLTTAKTTDTLYKYRGREGTSCTITRDPQMDTGSPMITAKTNLTLTNIELVGNKQSVTATANTRIINADPGTPKSILISLDRGAKLRDAAITGENANGGAIYLNNDAQLSIKGGSIRDCSAVNGGGVFIDGENGAMTMTVGTITKCEASENGGGVYFNSGKLTVDAPDILKSGFVKITGGNISRCTAQIGGGLYMNSGNEQDGESRHLYMSGGSISSNRASSYGGGIVVGDENARIYLSSAPYIYGNTSDSATAMGHSDVDGKSYSSSYTKADNLYMDRTFNFVSDYTQSDNPDTVIVSKGLIRGAIVGVYVPGDESTDPYLNHGDEGDPFGTYSGSTAGLNYFINDRNTMKGGLLAENQPAGNTKIYWKKIYSLAVTKQVISDNPDNSEKFKFKLELTGEIRPTTEGGQTQIPYDIDGQYGEIHFDHGVAEFKLSNGETRTAEMLPLGFGYKVTEELASAQRPLYKTSAENDKGVVSSQTNEHGDVYAEGEMNSNSTFVYKVIFSNLAAICKIVGEDKDGNRVLLYNAYNPDTRTNPPAVYTELVTAFNNVNEVSHEWYYKNENGGFERFYPVKYSIEMLIENYETEFPVTLMNQQTATLTTASKDADDGFPYVGPRHSVAVVKRKFSNTSMITVQANSDLTLGSITLDGNSDNNYSSNTDGGIVKVNNSGKLTVGDGTTLRNSTTSGKGAGVYLAQGATMYISDGPVFENNKKKKAVSESNPTNGGESGDTVYPGGTGAWQDIYIDGYSGAGIDATSLVVTGDITSGAGSIWVWADKDPHFIQNQQFAIMDNGGPYTGLNAFRNAKTDDQTKNPLIANNSIKYLYGISRDGKVYWSGGMNLTIMKNVVSPFAEPDVFNFTVSGLNNTYCAEKGCDFVIWTTADNGATWDVKEMEGNPGKKYANNAAITFQLAHNEKIVISIPRGMEVAVTEENSAPFTPSYQIDQDAAVDDNNTTGSISMDHDVTVKYTNTRKTQTVTVSKTLEDTQASGAVAFGFTALLQYQNSDVGGYTLYSGSSPSDSIVTANGEGTDPAGQATFTLSPTNSIPASIVLTIPYGTDLTVTENTSAEIANNITIVDVYDTTVSANSGSAVSESTHTFNSVTSDQTLAFTNIRKGTNLTITKNVATNMGGYDPDFTFTLVSVESETTGTEYMYLKEKKNGTTEGGWLTTAQGNNTFTLKHGESITIDVPNYKAIVIREDETNYSKVWSTHDTTATLDNANTATVTITLTDDANITVTNTRGTQNVTVKKVVDPVPVNTDPSFTFTASLMDGTEPISNYTVNSSDNISTDSNGQAVFSLSHNGTKSLTIPYGAKLVVTEGSTIGYTPSAEMVDTNDPPVSIPDDDNENSSFTVNSVAQDGIITFTNMKDIRYVLFDTNGGNWTESSANYQPLSEDLYEIKAANIIGNNYHPADPTRIGKIFIGWTEYADIAGATDFSSENTMKFGKISITPEIGEIVLDKIRSDFLWDFNRLASDAYGKTLYAVWSDAVTVTFDYKFTSNGSKLHTWNGPAPEAEGQYVFYSSDTGEISYTMAKGEYVPAPSNPSPHSEKPTWNFIRWLHYNTTTDSYRNNQKAPSDDKITTYAFDFSQRITDNKKLVTSWTANAPQIFTFTVENHVNGGSPDEEFDYTITVSNEYVLGRKAKGQDNTNHVPTQRWGSISTKLKNNEQYTVLVTVSYITDWGGANSVRIDVVDREGTVIKSGQVIYCAGGTYPNFVSDYKYTLTITQDEKTGFKTTVREENENPADSIDSDTSYQNRSFTFTSIENRSSSDSSFSSEVNNYWNGNGKDNVSPYNNPANSRAGDYGLTIVFTNTCLSRNLTVTKTVAGTENTSDNFDFVVAVEGITDDTNYWWKKYSKSDGTTYTSMTGTGSTGNGTLTSNANTIDFTLGHHQKIVIGGLPDDSTVTITENNGSYIASWLKDGEAIQPTGGGGTSEVTVTLAVDTVLDVTNTKAQEETIVAPTGINSHHTPFLLLLLFGLMLFIGGMGFIRKNGRNDDRSDDGGESAIHSQCGIQVPERTRASTRKRGDAG